MAPNPYPNKSDTIENLRKEKEQLKAQLSAAQASVSKARELYVLLTNSDQCGDAETGEIFYCADKHLMSKFDDLFKGQPEGGDHEADDPTR